jgi:hypothetical protein
LVAILPKDLLEQDGAVDNVGPALGLKGKAAFGQIYRRQSVKMYK